MIYEAALLFTPNPGKIINMLIFLTAKYTQFPIIASPPSIPEPLRITKKLRAVFQKFTPLQKHKTEIIMCQEIVTIFEIMTLKGNPQYLLT